MGTAAPCVRIDEDRQRAFKRLAKNYGKDAKSDFRRAGWLAFLGGLITIAGAAFGAAVTVRSDDRLLEGALVAVLFFCSSVPLWWQADRFRRSGLEHRRLKQHAATFVPFVDSLAMHERAGIVAPLGQVLFSRTYEDASPLRFVPWPESLSDTSANSSAEPDDK
jgi:hypothetical protein